MVTSVKSGHVALDLERSNRILVWGGYNDGQTGNRYCPSNLMYLYDPLVENWSVEVTKGEEPPGTSGAGAVFVDDYLYVVGGYAQSQKIVGYSGNTSNIYRLHLPTKTWEYVEVSGKKPIPVDKFCIWTDNEKIFIFGGFGLNPATLSSELYEMEDVKFVSDNDLSLHPRGWNDQFVIFDSNETKWIWPKYKGQKPSARAAHACAKLGRNVYVSGGRHCGLRMNDMHCFNTETLTWSGSLSITEPVPLGRSWHSLTPISETKLVLYGGLGNNQEPLSDCWMFDCNNLNWCKLQRSHMQPRLWHTANFSDDNELIILGGCTNNIQFHQAIYAKEMIMISISPKSLLRLCLDKLIMDKIETSSWDNLPKTLKILLEEKKLRN